ncbi:hypothetical protein LINGRAHAP2_LOCUS23344, partial [Linum grandiflorum]
EVGLLPSEGLAGFTPYPHPITVLVERRRPKTNTFHMFHRECTLALQDVGKLMSLTVMVDAVYAEYDNKRMDWVALVHEGFGQKSRLGICEGRHKFFIRALI